MNALCLLCSLALTPSLNLGLQPKVFEIPKLEPEQHVRKVCDYGTGWLNEIQSLGCFQIKRTCVCVTVISDLDDDTALSFTTLINDSELLFTKVAQSFSINIKIKL